MLRSKGRPGTSEEIKYAVPGLALVRNKPVVVLIDEGSASAAEMMAGALQDHKVAVILGVPSFGKGSTQAVIPLEPKTGAIKLTSMRWYTPVAQRPIQGHGIVPDIEAKLPEADADTFILRENNFARALPPELQTNAAQEKAPPAPQTPREKAPPVPQYKPIEDKAGEKESKDQDYQMLRALDVVNALHSIQKLNIFNPTKKGLDQKNIQNFRHNIG